MFLMTDDDKKDEQLAIRAMMKAASCKLVAFAKSCQTLKESVVYVDEDGNDAVVDVYGYTTLRVTSAMTLDSIAEKYLGNADYASIIAYYNGIKNYDVSAGTLLKIPQLSATQSNNANMIYSLPKDRDLYGRDIALDDDGDFLAKDGDLAIQSGKDNLMQALSMRLTTGAEKRVRLNSYGIKSQIGENALTNYLIATTQQTLKADPRIKEVNEINVSGDNDKVYLNFSFTDYNDNVLSQNVSV